MNNVMTNGFCELNENEMMMVDGGSVVGTAIAFVSACGAALAGGFMAGRAFVRDIKEKFFN